MRITFKAIIPSRPFHIFAGILLLFCLLFSMVGCAAEKMTKAADLSEFYEMADTFRENPHGDLHSDLLIFPENIEQTSLVDYAAMQADGVFDGSYLLYLVCRYEPEAYAEEIERLQHIEVPFETQSKSPLYSEIGFAYPAYISTFDGYGSYEYALLDEENRQIIYICDQLVSFEETDIPAEYRPSGYAVPTELCDTGRKGYTMYYLFDSEGNGERASEQHIVAKGHRMHGDVLPPKRKPKSL